MNMIWSSAYFRIFLGSSALVLALLALGSIDLHGYKRAGEAFLVFLCLAYLASLAHGKIRDGSIVVCSIIFGLATLEALAVKSEKTSLPVQGKGFSVHAPNLGWGPSHAGRYPARKTDPQSGAIIYDVTYTIDDKLLRKTISEEDGRTIAFFGDSFTFGEGVNDAETMPQVFADLSDHDLRVLNLGFPGYGPQQFLRALESGMFDTLLGTQPRLFVFLTIPWHAERTACKSAWTPRAPRYELENNHIIFRGVCNEGPSQMWREWLENTALYRVAIEPYRQKVSHDDIELYIRILLAAADHAKQKYGVATLIPYLRAGDYYLRGTGFSDAAIIEQLQEGGAIVIDASLTREEAEGAAINIPGDGHPTPFAHRARALMIKAHIDQELSGTEFSRLK